jgi:pimeloyl-ACP methyl ester carboxylesterase
MKRGWAIAAASLLGTAAVLSIVGAFQRPRTTLPPGVEGKYVLIDGVPIRYVQAGRGPDVLLIHGSPGSVEDWAPIFERLTDRYRVTAYDRPGHGYSGGADLPHTPDRNALVALELIRTLGLRDVVLVGHSYGGITGLALALRHPPEVQKFVLVGTRAYSPVKVDLMYRALAVPWFGAGLSAALAPFIGAARVEAGVRESFAPDLDRIPEGFVASRVPLWTHPTVTTTLSQERVELEASLDAMAPLYPQIRSQVVVVCGNRDTRAWADFGRLTGDHPALLFVVLSGAGHYVQYTRPDELARIITAR